MNENLMQESTQPEVDNAEENANVETKVDENTAEDAKPEAENGQSEESTEENAQVGEGEESTEQPEEPAPPKLRVKFNKQEREYSLEDATPLVEQGLKWDSFKPTHEKLKFLATSNGLSVPDMVEKLIESADSQQYQKTLEECGGNEAVAKRLFEADKAERQRKFDEAVANEAKQAETEAESENQQLADRLARNYEELIKEYPNIKKFDDIPQSVVKTAIDKNISLFDAYLRYERQESRKAEAVKTKQTANAKQSTGSMSGNQATPQPEIEDFTKALHNALF